MKVIQLQSYENWGCGYADHLEQKGIKVGRFYLAKESKVQFPSKRDVVKRELKGIVQLICHLNFYRNARVYSTGGQFSAMFISRLFSWALGKDYHLFLHNFYLHSLGNNKWIQTILRFLMNNDKLTLIAQTPKEISFYRKLSDKMQLEFIPYCSDVKERKNNVSISEGGIFTGGYTNRDYYIMTKLAKMKPNLRFTFVASNLNNDIKDLPDNVVLIRNVSTNEFASLMEKAAVVVVPLKEDVGSSGQMLCIQAMRYHKPIVYADASSINYYFTKESGIPYKIGNIQSLSDAIDSLYLDEKKTKAMGENAYKLSLKFTSANCLRLLDAIILNKNR